MNRRLGNALNPINFSCKSSFYAMNKSTLVTSILIWERPSQIGDKLLILKCKFSTLVDLIKDFFHKNVNSPLLENRGKMRKCL